MDIKQIAEHLKDLGIAEIKKLASILESDVETDIGLTLTGKPIIGVKTETSPTPTCDPGYYYDAETKSCILNVGG